MGKNKYLISFFFAVFALLAIILAFPGFNAYTLNNIPHLNPYYFDINFFKSHQISNLLYNSFHTWSFDPVVKHLVALFSGENIDFPVLNLVLIGILLFGLIIFIGSLLSFIENTYFHYGLSLIFSVLILFAVLTNFYIDTVLLATIAWLPLFCFACHSFFSNKLGSSFILVPSGIIAIIANQQFAIIIIPLILLFFAFQRPEHTHYLRRQIQVLAVVTLLIVIVIQHFFQIDYLPQTQHTAFPDYPKMSKLIDTHHTIFPAQEFFKKSPQFVFENLYSQRQNFFNFTPIVFLFVLLGMFSVRNNRRIYYPLILLGLVILLDQFAPAAKASILPVETIQTIIPKTLELPLLVNLIAVFFILCIHTLLKNRQVLLALLLIISLSLHKYYLYSPSEHQTIFDYRNYFEKTLDSTKLSQNHLEKIFNSPSNYLIQRYWKQITFKVDRKDINWISIKNRNPEVVANFNNELSPLLYDANPATRWTNSAGKQTGKETIWVRLNKPVNMRGLQLDIGKYHSDYPRGLRISALEQCQEFGKNDAYEVIASYPKWSGAVLYTDQGYPYFGQDYQTVINFPKRRVQCLKIDQTGLTSNFDWSVTEINYRR